MFRGRSRVERFRRGSKDFEWPLKRVALALILWNVGNYGSTNHGSARLVDGPHGLSKGRAGGHDVID